MKPNDFRSNPRHIPVFRHVQTGKIDLWMDACSSIFGIATVEKEDIKKDHRLTSWHVEPITIASSHYHGMVTRHSNWHVEETGHQIHVHRYREGRASVETAGLPVECETGAITLLDYSRQFTSLHTENECESFYVPHTAINYRPSDAPHSPVYPANSTLGRLLGREMDHILAMLKAGATAIDPDDIHRFLGCVELAMQPGQATASARQQARESLKRSIQEFIELRLDQPDLNVVLILQNFGVSRASLYRMFEPDDGVRNYIGRRRLYRAVTDLAGSPHTRGMVAEVSERWGFASGSSFNRIVRREFGVPPGALFQAPIANPSQHRKISRVHELMLEAARPSLEDA